MLIGTAGHVDHGKSTLVEALTGINPMHLPEEHRRELTIELGFAHLRHPDGYTLGVVDVPGHEKLVKTMISGASGFQIALLVVDAREGLMPQSLEHLDVLKLLGVPRIIPVVTKAGVASKSEIQETVDATQRLVGGGSVQVVDSFTGGGIPELKETLFAACRSLNPDKTVLAAPPYLPIDRCFVLKGVGIVVTGTLVRGELKVGQSVALSSHPGEYRIRSLHNHNASVSTLTAGHRVGVQLNGLRLEDVERGDVLTAPEYPCRSRFLNVTLDLLKGSPFSWKPGQRAHFLTGASEMECRLWGLVHADTTAWVQVHLPREACFYRGQRFILRSTNPLVTVGGGTIVDIAPERPRKVTEAEQHRDRYFEIARPAVFELAALAKKWMWDQPEVPVGARIASGLAWSNRLDDLVRAKIDEWIGRANGEPAEWPFAALSSTLRIKPQYLHAYLESFLAERFKGVLTLTSTTLKYDPRRGELSEPERKAAEDLFTKVRSAELQPLRFDDYFAASGVDRKVFDKAAARLLKEGRLIRISNEFVLETSVWEALKTRVRRTAAASFTASEFGKDLGLSRKYSVPYLECLNRMGVLRRQGDRHVVVRQ